MKKFFGSSFVFANLLALGFAQPSFAVQPSSKPSSKIDELNQLLADTLKPLNIVDASGLKVSEASLVFTQLETTDAGTKALAGKLVYDRKGSQRNLKFSFEGSYVNPQDGTDPALALSAVFNSDFVIQMTNAKSFEDLVKTGENDNLAAIAKEGFDMAKGILGPVESDSVQITTSRTTDANRAIASASLVIEAKIDFADPRYAGREEVFMATHTKISFKVGKDKTQVSVEATPNIKASYFKKDQQGLKEFVDALLAKDPKTVSQLQWIVELVNSFAMDYTEKANP